MTISAEQVERYRRDGYLNGIRVFDAEGAAEIRRQFDALEQIEGPEKCQIGLLDRHFDQEFVWKLATHPTVLGAVTSLLGPDVLLIATHFFCKYGANRVERFVAWHQDVTYWGLEPPLALTAWYAVDDSDAGNGCMRVIPGTHREGIREHGTSGKDGNLLSVNQEVPVSPEEERSAVDLTLRAGEISLHDGALIHGSAPNLSSRRRCGLTLRYVPASVRPVSKNTHGKDWSAILVHGEDRDRHFRPIAPPFSMARG